MSTMIKTCRIILIVSIIALMSMGCNAIPQTDLDKIKVFYKYDNMFFYGHKDADTSVESGSNYEIENIKEISKQYQKGVQELLCKIDMFIESNFNLLVEYHSWVERFDSDNNLFNEGNNHDMFYETDAKLDKTLREELLDAQYGIIRCMYAIDSIQYIETAIEIGEDVYANTLDFTIDTIDNVYWTGYIYGSKSTKHKREEVIDENGHIKYREWFYESNLKIRIVRQVRDKEEKYYGEIYIDYYKIDEYGNLFDKDGNPKNVNTDVK